MTFYETTAPKVYAALREHGLTPRYIQSMRPDDMGAALADTEFGILFLSSEQKTGIALGVRDLIAKEMKNIDADTEKADRRFTLEVRAIILAFAAVMDFGWAMVNIKWVPGVYFVILAAAISAAWSLACVLSLVREGKD